MKKIKGLVIQMCVSTLLVQGLAPFCWAQRLKTQVGHRAGYLMDVGEEKNLLIHEMVFINRPKRPAGPRLNDLIFDSQLKRDFRIRYEQQFGRTDAEQNIDAPNRFADLEYANGVRVTPEQDVIRKRAFGEYMVKKLVEHHVDNYLKSSPTARPIYVLKERISKVNLEVKKGYKVNINYSYSGNSLRFAVDSPYDLQNRLTIQMDPTSFGPSEVQEAILYVAYPISKTVSVSTDYKVNQEIFTVIGRKRLSPSTMTTLTASTYATGQEDSSRNHRLILGLTWTN